MANKLGIVTALFMSLWGLYSVALQKEALEYQRLFNDLATNRKPPNSTEFVFARIQFTSHGPGRGPRGNRAIEGWAHDYPFAEEHILQIASEATGINLNKDSYVMVRLDGQELFKYPFALLSEVGEMTMTPPEVTNLREYLNRGGFIMVDDFDGPGLAWFLAQMKMVFPNREFVPLNVEHPLFHAFYDVKTLDIEPPYAQRGMPKFYGYLDDQGRVIMILNHNNDFGELWEWVDEARFPLPPSITALQFGTDYIVYSLTH